MMGYLQGMRAGKSALISKHLGFAPGPHPLGAPLSPLTSLACLIGLWGGLLLGCACVLGGGICCIVLLCTYCICTCDCPCMQLKILHARHTLALTASERYCQDKTSTSSVCAAVSTVIVESLSPAAATFQSKCCTHMNSKSALIPCQQGCRATHQYAA